jgi:hypothetical protein
MPPNLADILIEIDNENEEDITPAYLSTYKGEVTKLKRRLRQLG